MQRAKGRLGLSRLELGLYKAPVEIIATPATTTNAKKRPKETTRIYSRRRQHNDEEIRNGTTDGCQHPSHTPDTRPQPQAMAGCLKTRPQHDQLTNRK